MERWRDGERERERETDRDRMCTATDVRKLLLAVLADTKTQHLP